MGILSKPNDIEGEIKNVEIESTNPRTSPGENGENPNPPITKFDVIKYLEENMVSIEKDGLDGVMEVLKYPVTQAFYKSVVPEKKFDEENQEFPADRISWSDAIAFCNKLSSDFHYKPCYEQIKGKWIYDDTADGFRLPTVEEWKYVASEGQSNFEYDDLDKVAWYSNNSHGMLHVIKTKDSNKLGLYDICGNVKEWCWDTDGDPKTRILCGGCATSSEKGCKINLETFDSNNIGEQVKFNGFRLYRNNKNAIKRGE